MKNLNKRWESIEIYGLDITDNITDEIVQSLLRKITKNKQEKLKRYVYKDDVKRSLFAELLIRYLVGKRIHQSNRQIEMHYNKYGKPFLKDISNLNFNLSHSGKWVVCILDDLPVGIDIEKVQPIDIEMAMQFFSKLEVAQIRATSQEKKINKFYDIWTLKESFIKCVGKGLSVPLDSFSIIDDKFCNPRIKIDNQLEPYFLKQYSIDSNYKLAVCAKHGQFPQHIRKLSPLEIQNWFIKDCN